MPATIVNESTPQKMHTAGFFMRIQRTRPQSPANPVTSQGSDSTQLIQMPIVRKNSVTAMTCPGGAYRQM